MIGSEVLFMSSHLGDVVSVRHLIIENSSQWVIGRNVTKFSNIVHIDGNYLQLPRNAHGINERISLINQGKYSYILM